MREHRGRLEIVVIRRLFLAVLGADRLLSIDVDLVPGRMISVIDLPDWLIGIIDYIVRWTSGLVSRDVTSLTAVAILLILQRNSPHQPSDHTHIPMQPLSAKIPSSSFTTDLKGSLTYHVVGIGFTIYVRIDLIHCVT